MKLTKETLKRMIKEELEGSIAGKDIPNEAKYPELLGGIKKLLDGAFGKKYSLFRELKAMAEYYATKKPNLDSIGDKETASGPSDTGHVFVVSKPGDPIWGIFSSEAKVEEFLKGKGKDVDYPYYKYVLDPLSDKGK